MHLNNSKNLCSRVETKSMISWDSLKIGLCWTLPKNSLLIILQMILTMDLLNLDNRWIDSHLSLKIVISDFESLSINLKRASKSRFKSSQINKKLTSWLIWDLVKSRQSHNWYDLTTILIGLWISFWMQVKGVEVWKSKRTTTLRTLSQWDLIEKKQSML